MKRFFLTVTAIIVFTGVSYSQASCSSFSINSITPDSLNPNVNQVSVFYNSAINDFVGYTFVAAVLDCNGDTVATGTSFWFGQMGQTSQDYPITVTGNLTCQPLTIVFNYLNGSADSDTCLLPYSITGLSPGHVAEKPLVIFPNPTQRFVNVVIPLTMIGSTYEVYDVNGKPVLSGDFVSKINSIDLGNCLNGVYIVCVNDVLKEIFHIVKEQK